MSKEITRRNFIKTSAAAGVSTAIGTSTLSNIIDGALNTSAAQETVDISVVTGTDYFENTIKAVDKLGGMETLFYVNQLVLLIEQDLIDRNNDELLSGLSKLAALLEQYSEVAVA